MAKSKQRKRTIDASLLKAWKSQTRLGDAARIAELLGYSRPTIDNALIYGAVKIDGLVDGINKFFTDRIVKEKEDAYRINNLSYEDNQQN